MNSNTGNAISSADGMSKIGSTNNGVLFQIDGSKLLVLHLYGTAEQMGEAEGSLLKDRIMAFFNDYIPFLVSFLQTEPVFQGVPEDYQRVLAPGGSTASITASTVKQALLAVVRTTAPYTPDYFVEEAMGVATGLGSASQNELIQGTDAKPYEMVLAISMWGELVKAGCSILGANSSATESQQIVQLRALDFGFPVPLVENPLLKVYHPDSGASSGHDFITLGWVGFMGALTGYSQFNALSPKSWAAWKTNEVGGGSLSEHYNSDGIPWNFLARDILQFDESMSATENRIANAHRTCSVYIGVGSRPENLFRVFEYSYDRVAEFAWNTQFPGYQSQPATHPNINDVMYVDKFKQPSDSPLMAENIQACQSAGGAGQGHVGVDDLKNFCRDEKTGDVHIAIFDFGAETMDIAIASLDAASKWIPACSTSNQDYIKLDAKALLDLKL